MRKIFWTVLLGFVVVAGACSDDSEEREMIVIDIEGSWTMEAALDQDQGELVCQISDLSLDIDMQGNTQLFGGRTLGGTISCTGGEQPLEESLPVMAIGSGIQDKGSEVSFSLAVGSGNFDTYVEFDGNLTGTRMEGQVQGWILLEELGEAPAFTGSFTLVRTST